MNTLPLFLSTSQVAEFVGTNRSTIKRYVEIGLLTPAGKLSGLTGSYVWLTDQLPAIQSVVEGLRKKYPTKFTHAATLAQF